MIINVFKHICSRKRLDYIVNSAVSMEVTFILSRFFSSVLFSVSAKLLGKLLGLFSTFVTARILAPEDFGLIAIISIALYFFDILSHAASEQYIVRKRTISFIDYNTAWSLNLCLKCGVSLLVILLSPLISSFFDNSDLTFAFAISALVLPLQALKSPGLLLARRQLRFEFLFWHSFGERLFAVPVLIALALWLESFWAFILTDLLSGLFGTLLSYILLRRFPKFSLTSAKTQWAFSKWMLAKSVVGYLRSQIDTIFVAKHFSPFQLGQYHMARELAMMPAHYALSPAIEPLLTVFKNTKRNIHDLLDKVSFSIYVTMVVALPIGAILVIFSQPVVHLLLGEQWQLASSLLPVLSLLFLYWSISQIVELAFVALGKVKLLFLYDVMSLTLITVTLLTCLFVDATLLSFAVSRVVSGTVAMMLFLFVLYRGNTRLLKPLLGPILMAATALVVAFVPSYMLTRSIPFIETLTLSNVLIVVFSIAFSVITYFLMIIVGARFIRFKYCSTCELFLREKMSQFAGKRFSQQKD